MSEDSSKHDRSKYVVVDRELFESLRDGQYTNAAGMAYAFKGSEWRIPLEEWDREKLLDFFLGKAFKEFLLELAYDQDKQDQGTSAYELAKPGRRPKKTTAWKTAFLLGESMIRKNLTFSDLFKGAPTEDAAIDGDYSGFDGWYFSHRPNRDKRQFGLVKIHPPGDKNQFELEGYTFDNNVLGATEEEVYWHSIECVINPKTMVGFYVYHGEVEGKSAEGMAILRFRDRKNGLVKGARGTTLDDRLTTLKDTLHVSDDKLPDTQFTMRLERIDLDRIPLPDGRDDPLDMTENDDRLLVIRHFYEKHSK